MNFPQNSLDADLNLNLKIASSKDSITQDILKLNDTNKMTIKFNKETKSSEDKKKHLKI